MKKLILLALLLACDSVLAQTFVRELTYNANDSDSKLSCRDRAKSQLCAAVLNEVGVHVSSTSSLRTREGGGEFKQDFSDNIRSSSAGIAKYTILSESWDGQTYVVKAEIVVDEKSVGTAEAATPDDFDTELKAMTTPVQYRQIKDLYKNLHKYQFKDMELDKFVTNCQMHSMRVVLWDTVEKDIVAPMTFAEFEDIMTLKPK